MPHHTFSADPKYSLDYDALHKDCHDYFSKVADHRSSNASIRLADHFMSAMALFQLKYASMLAIRNKTNTELVNTRRLFHIKRLPSDTCMRETLDGQSSPDIVRPLFESFAKRLESSGKMEKRVEWFLKSKNINRPNLYR